MQGERQRLSGAGGLSAEQFLRADLARYLQASSDPTLSALLEANRGSQGHAAEDLHREVTDTTGAVRCLWWMQLPQVASRVPFVCDKATFRRLSAAKSKFVALSSICQSKFAAGDTALYLRFAHSMSAPNLT